MRKVVKKNKILDENATSDLFSESVEQLKEPVVKTPSKVVKKRTKSVTKPLRKKRVKKVIEDDTNESSDAFEPVTVDQLIGELTDDETEKEITRKKRLNAAQTDGESMPNELNPQDIEIVTRNERISKRLAQHLWQELNPVVLDSLKDSILDIYIEPVVLEASKSDRLRDRLRDLIEQLVVQLIERVRNVKLPVQKGTQFLNLEAIFNKKMYLESVLSSNLKQIDYLKKELIKYEKFYNADSKYYDQLAKRIEEDELVRDIEPVTNSDHKVYNLAEPLSSVSDPQFEVLLSKLERHLQSIDANVLQLSALNEKVTVLNDLLKLV